MTGVSYLRRQLERLLRVEPAAKPAIYRQLFDASDRTSLEYWIELVMSAGIATLGLVLDSPAVVIGAMLISPLMGPILALGLALTLGDLYLGVRSAVTIAFSIVLAVVVSAAIAWMLRSTRPRTRFSRAASRRCSIWVSPCSRASPDRSSCRREAGAGA